MSRRITERRLVDVLMHHIRKASEVSREVRHYEKRIDLAYISHNSGELVAIEAKTRDWARALSQAVVNLAAADRSYIAIYARNVRNVDVERLAKHGVGLISVGLSWGDVEFVQEARPSPYANRLAIERLKALVSSGG